MEMVKLLISVPKGMKAKLDALRKEGTSASGFIRNLLEKEFKHRKDAQS
jgi:metal-responsive CopG/Arc/MetJ family transcriptional regulator